MGGNCQGVNTNARHCLHPLMFVVLVQIGSNISPLYQETVPDSLAPSLSFFIPILRELMREDHSLHSAAGSHCANSTENPARPTVFFFSFFFFWTVQASDV